jgi:hypothetical protein
MLARMLVLFILSGRMGNLFIVRLPDALVAVDRQWKDWKSNHT